ncbi:TetR/AcrR family transcriptional regulator [Gordonia caeni]|uniref:TetR/AcrR family transcriptional regulator n=1 Tax=Gordonia caeni TaxID=1007097 RepID=A0ABP7NTA7_9ACTN
MEMRKGQSDGEAGTDSDPIRSRLVDEAYRIISQSGVAALTVRGLAAASGVSTMAVYTRFGSVGAVAGAVCERGFTEFAEVLESFAASDDPVADLQLLGLAYLDFATAHPQLYTLMFQHTSPEWDELRRSNLVVEGRPTDSPAGRRAFEAMMATLQRGVDADGGNLLLMAGEVWSAVHGLAMLSIAGHLSGAHDLVAESLLVTLAVGRGVDRKTARAGLQAAKDRLAAGGLTPPRAAAPPVRAPSDT